MKKARVGPANDAIEEVVDLLAEAQIQRRRAGENSPEFHSLTGTIVAYGKVLGLLSRMRELEEEAPEMGGPFPVRRGLGLLRKPSIVWFNEEASAVTSLGR